LCRERYITHTVNAPQLLVYFYTIVNFDTSATLVAATNNTQLIMTPEEIVSRLGFNTLEAEVYVALLKHGPQTAYKVGKMLNRPTANVYKAMDALLSAGAIEVQEGDVKVCSAIPVKALAAQLQRDYKNRLEQAVEKLAHLKPDTPDEGIYRLQTVESVFQRARDMLKRAEQVAVADLFPGPLNELKDLLNSLPAKKVEVYVETYVPVKMARGVSVAVPAVSNQALKFWKAQQLNLAIDGREILIALFNEDLTELIQATYSNNLYLSCIVYSGLLSEHKVIRFSNAGSLAEVKQLAAGQKFFFNSKVPGLEQLLKAYKA